jgi:hypothetical protein
MAQIVPLTSAPTQSIRVTLSVNGAALTLNLRLYFNTAGGFWVMDIADQIGKALVSSVPLITGAWPAANILAPFDYLKIGSAFVINQVGSASEWPNANNLGSGFLLLWDSN